MDKPAEEDVVKRVGVEFPQYCDGEILSVYWGTRTEALKMMADIEGPAFLTDVDELGVNTRGFVVTDGSGVAAWVCNSPVDTGSAQDYGILMHELLHAVLKVRSNRGIGLVPNHASNQESLAYDLHFAVRKVLEKMMDPASWYEHCYRNGFLFSTGYGKVADKKRAKKTRANKMD